MKGKLEAFLAENGRRIGMYALSPELFHLSAFMEGFDLCTVLSFGSDASELDGFREWLILTIGGSRASAWPAIIRDSCSNVAASTDKCLELFGRFRAEVAQRGLKAILKDHYDFEVREYGAPCTSHYFLAGWDRKPR